MCVQVLISALLFKVQPSVAGVGSDGRSAQAMTNRQLGEGLTVRAARLAAQREGGSRAVSAASLASVDFLTDTAPLNVCAELLKRLKRVLLIVSVHEAKLSATLNAQDFVVQ